MQRGAPGWSAREGSSRGGCCGRRYRWCIPEKVRERMWRISWRSSIRITQYILRYGFDKDDLPNSWNCTNNYSKQVRCRLSESRIFVAHLKRMRFSDVNQLWIRIIVDMKRKLNSVLPLVLHYYWLQLYRPCVKRRSDAQLILVASRSVWICNSCLNYWLEINFTWALASVTGRPLNWLLSKVTWLSIEKLDVSLTQA